MMTIWPMPSNASICNVNRHSLRFNRWTSW